MKKQNFHRIGMSERQAALQLIWTMGWGAVMLVISIASFFQP